MSSLPLQAKRSKAIMVHHVWSSPPAVATAVAWSPSSGSASWVKTEMVIFGYHESFSKFYRNLGLNGNGNRKYENGIGRKKSESETETVWVFSDRFQKLLFLFVILPSVINSIFFRKNIKSELIFVNS
jgi:hypothetical protein